ncbi:MAG: helix-turn-helix domain-containing protein [Planctomycetes bacterium]|nr:helix-turn-helix domain-containing protein [Planctomycetota bacterium]
MIKNERQYRITKAQAEKFVSALNKAPLRKGADPLLAQLEVNALRSQLDELREQLAEFDELQSGRRGVLCVESFDQLPHALVQARIAAGLSHKELAERLGLKEQQVQRYEATDYGSASLARLQEVVTALGVSLREELFLPIRSPSPSALFERLSAAGIERDFVLERILPPNLAKRMAATSPVQTETEMRQAASTIGRVFRWNTEDILGSEPLTLNSEAAGIARFKVPARADERRLSAFTVYAHYLSLLVLDATPTLQPKQVPTDAEEFRDALLSESSSVSLERVLAFAWSLGVAVLPLTDHGAFHGACWRNDGRNVIVLKQRTSSLARWINDCLHEMYHAGQEPEAKERSIIEDAEMSPERRESEEEQEATIFAGDVILDGRAEELVNMCINAASGQVPRLKSAVPIIAESEGVEVGALANYMAFRLSLQGINWWGTAANLQNGDADPWEIARDWLLPRLDLERLNEIDRHILVQALTSTKE